MLKTPILILFTVALAGALQAADISAENKAYAGKTIMFYSYSDPVSMAKEFVFSLDFDKDGKCKSTVSLNQTKYAFAEFGIYRGMFVLKPNTKTELRFPPLREKSFADKKNPYFEPVEFWFATKSGDQVTDKISDFDNSFNRLTDKYLNHLYFRQSKEAFDSLKTVLNNDFPAVDSDILAVHKKLKLNLLQTDAFRLETSKVSSTLSGIDETFWTIPSFIEFFEKIFSDKLSQQVKSLHGEELKDAVGKSNTNYLLEFVRDEYNIDNKFARLVLIKLLHDGFYSGDFSQSSMLNMLKSVTLSSSEYPEIRAIAKRVSDKLEFLRPQSKAPVICLQNIDGYEICTDKLTDKYKYLIFADTEMIVCREHLKYLAEIQRKFEDHLQIVIVLRKTDLIEMKMFLVQNDIPGVKLIDENGEYIQQYRVKSFPMAFLLGKNHEIVFEHAKTPLDGFEQQFGYYLQQKLFMEQRNQSR